MDNSYVVIGSGRQGTASAYDLATQANASEVILADINERVAKSAATRVNKLSGSKICRGLKLDVQNKKALKTILKDVDGCLSAVPYYYNLAITKAAITAKANMTDLGGNAQVVAEQLKLDKEAKKAGITIIPDCGMGPGMTGSLASYGISQMDEAQDVFIWDGGLPQKPEPPWNYKLTFHINGLTNEYDGQAVYLRQGRKVKVPCFTEYELVDFPPLGKLEAFVTSGGTSTAIRVYKGKLRTYQNKTLRYPGHFEQFKAYQLLGLFQLEPIKVGRQKVVPREVFHALIEPKIKASPGFKDICLIRVLVRGKKDGRLQQLKIEVVDKYDTKTHFTAMERLTGWHAAIMLEMAVRGMSKKGVLPLEKAVDPLRFLAEAKKRGFKIKEEWTNID